MNNEQFLKRIECAKPIIQAPMAGVQNWVLASAVSNAGGLGSLPAAMLSLEMLYSELQQLQQATQGRPYNVNFFCHQTPIPNQQQELDWRAALLPYYRELELDPHNIAQGPSREPFSRASFDVLKQFQPKVVSFHFGLPKAEFINQIKDWGGVILSSATTVAEARWLEQNGADAVIAQGLEAGGHRGMFLSDDLTAQLTTFALVPQIVAQVQIPVIAAGGIADAQGVRAMGALGASAVQIGTSFMLCDEALTSPLHRAALQGERRDHTALTNLFTGRPARGLVNRLMCELGPLNPVAPQFPLATAAIAPLRTAAEKKSLNDFTPMWCGQNATGCNAVPAAQLLDELLDF
jgi:nitronate monooxygenase